MDDEPAGEEGPRAPTPDDLERIANALNAEGARYAVIGGFAMMMTVGGDTHAGRPMLISRNIALRALLFGAIGCQAVDTAPAPSCENPAPVLLASGQPSGFERCADGTVNRVAEATFEPTNTSEACHGDETTKACVQDADCASGTNGRCIQGAPAPMEVSCNCEYACATDADCAAGTVCVPPEVTTSGRPVCVPATCKTSADCPSGECGLAASHNGCYEVTELRCRDSASDQCRSDVDCTELGVAYTCDNAGAGLPFRCVARSCVIGRPLLVSGVARVARAMRRSDWGAAA